MAICYYENLIFNTSGSIDSAILNMPPRKPKISLKSASKELIFLAACFSDWFLFGWAMSMSYHLLTISNSISKLKHGILYCHITSRMNLEALNCPVTLTKILALSAKEATA